MTEQVLVSEDVVRVLIAQTVRRFAKELATELGYNPEDEAKVRKQLLAFADEFLDKSTWDFKYMSNSS